MRKIFFKAAIFGLTLLVSLFVWPGESQASTVSGEIFSSSILSKNTSFELSRQVLSTDIRVNKVAKYLEQYDSPLAYFAPDFVAAADKYGLDYRLLVAISGVESTYGKFYLAGTFNVYGWGQGRIAFQSWSDGIDEISKGLKTGYLEKGAKDIWQIGRIYNPPNSDNWSATVSSIMDKIEAVNVAGFAPHGPQELQKLPLTI